VKKKTARAPRKTRTASKRARSRAAPLLVWRAKRTPPRTPKPIPIRLDDENRPVLEGILHILRDRLEALRALGPHEYRSHRYLATVSVILIEHMLSTNPQILVIDDADVIRHRVVLFLDELCAEGVRQVRDAKLRALVAARMREFASQWAVCARCQQTVRVIPDDYGQGRLEAHLPCGIYGYGVPVARRWL
jgi:hypothetical protein